jgi:hypothetical protein
LKSNIAFCLQIYSHKILKSNVITVTKYYDKTKTNRTKSFKLILDCNSSLYCKNGGTCSNINGGKDYTCNCADGWMGSNCEHIGKLYYMRQKNVYGYDFYVLLRWNDLD